MKCLLFAATIPERSCKATRKWVLVGFAESQEACVAALKSQPGMGNCFLTEFVQKKLKYRLKYFR
jgi:hypothetical protein